jgi:hypothetical protein
MLQDSAKLPDTWSPDFTITLSTTAMRGSSKLTLTYDSGEYARESKPKVFKISETDRVEILKKLKELGIESVTSKAKMTVVNDGWSQTICYGSHCIQAGSSTEMSEANSEIFSNAYDYLQAFATKKLAKGKKK